MKGYTKMSIGTNIKQKRKAAGLTQIELAKLSGITQAMLCQIERGTKNPSLQVSLELANQLGCKVEDFIEK